MKYDYGASVVFDATTDDGDSLSKYGEIVGITEVENEQQSVALRASVGSVLYTVEFADGSDALVPEDALSPTATR